MNCYLCGNKSLTKLNKYYSLCDKCETAISIKNEKEYDDTYYYGGEERSNSLKKRAVKIFKVIHNFLKKEDNILDFGCNTGSFVSEVNKNHYKCDGVDINKRDIDIAKSIDSYNYYLPSEIKREYDVVVAFDVIEHFNDFNNFFNEGVDKYLKKDGLLIATTPNYNSNWKNILKYWHGWSIPEYHRTILSGRSIYFLAEKYDYKVIEIGEKPLLTSKVWKYFLNGRFPKNTLKLKKLVFLPIIFLEYLILNAFNKLNNDTLFIILQKKF